MPLSDERIACSSRFNRSQRQSFSSQVEVLTLANHLSALCTEKYMRKLAGRFRALGVSGHFDVLYTCPNMISGRKSYAQFTLLNPANVSAHRQNRFILHIGWPLQTRSTIWETRVIAILQK